MIRHLGAVDYGYFVTVSSIVFVLGGITEAGLTNLAVRELSVLPRAEHGPFLRNVVGLRLVLTATGTALATALTAVTGAPAAVVQGTAISGFALLDHHDAADLRRAAVTRSSGSAGSRRSSC